MSNGKPFKARLGLDANNEKVVNVAQPEVGTDVVNLDYYNTYNTLQPFSASRTYPANFLVEYSDRVWKSRGVTPAGSFDQSMWTEIHAFGRWIRITGNYAAQPGDNLVVNTASASITVTLPAAEDGDVVYVVDEGSAVTNPIIVAPTSATINGAAGNYEINTPGSVYFVYVGGTWKVNSIDRTSAQWVNTNFTARPNSLNMVDTSAARTVTLPPKPKDGQWVIIQAGGSAQLNNITVQSSPATIQGAASYAITRGFENVTFIYNATAGHWKYVTSKNDSRIVDTLTPIPNQQITIALDNTVKNITLPDSIAGDWVEVVATHSDEVAHTGAIQVTTSTGTTFKTDGVTGPTSTIFRITKRSQVLFVLKGTEWNILVSEDAGLYGGAKSGSAQLVRNTFYEISGTSTGTLLLPPRNSLQPGDTVAVKVNVAADRALIQVNDTVNETIGGVTSDTWLPIDTGQVVTYCYDGYNGTKYNWTRIRHADGMLQKSRNLADVPDKAAGRTALDVFSKGESDARFLPINGTADNAQQAANADKLDNLDSTDFIQVKNPNVVAVDANTTSETRFTTNVGTPNTSELWHVVMFVDTATGDKAQLAMAKANTKIAYRAYSSSAWSAWSYLDQAANSATATKLLTARTINGVSFDGTANITVTANPTVTAIAASTDLDTLQTPGEYNCAANATAVTLINCPTTNAFGLDVDKTSGVCQTIREYSISAAGMRSWFRSFYGGNWSQWYRVYDEANPQPDVSGNAGTATKWQTPRTISFTGGLTGSAILDGSADVSVETTVNPGAHTHTIANVTGLQAALDGKLGATAKAADSELLDGVNGADYRKAVVPSNAGEDPNTTITDIILTNHANTPNSSFYWYIETSFYQSRSASSNRFQFASQYNGGASVQFRQYFGGVWGSWVAVAAIVDGNTYNINISGNSATATDATKLATPRTINGVSFDGSANITVADSTKVAKAGDTITGKIVTGDGSTRSVGIYGTYDSTKTAHVWSMGTAYSIPDTGADFGTLYGMAYKHTNNPTGGTMAGGHQIVYCNAGVPGVSIGLGGTIWQLGVLTSAGVDLSNATSLRGTTNGLQITNSTFGTVEIGNRNTSYTHYSSSSTAGHYFYGNVTIQTALAVPTLNVSGAVNGGSLSVAGVSFSGTTYTFDSWVRTEGSTGWFNNTYSGGMYMVDTTWVRVYNAKALYVANQIAATGNITAYYSDERLKENLKPIPNALETVKSWTGYSYNANVVAQSFGYDPNKKEIGLLAQDVQKTTPEAVEQAPFDLTAIKGKSLTGKHYLTLKYERLVPVLVEAIKEQDAEIQILKEQVQFLMEEFKKLKV